MKIRVKTNKDPYGYGLGYPRNPLIAEFLHSFFIGQFGRGYIRLQQIFI